MRKIIVFFMLMSGLFCMSVNAQTTKAADKLYAQGVTYMKTMTISSQKKAISSFEKAKIAYDTKSKKDLCDEQILACNNIIRKLSTPKPKPEESNQEPVVIKDTVKVVEVPDTPEVSLVLTPTSLEIPAKGGRYVEISIECSGDNWEITSCPEWISYEKTSTKILVKAEKNKEKTERAGVLTVTCENKKAEVIIKQLKKQLKLKIS